MSDALEKLALRKQLLIARSALCRLRIHQQFVAMPVWSAVLGLALTGVALKRGGRLFAIAARTMLFARLACIAMKLWRTPGARRP
jgi:hypothetical protein